MSVWNSESAEWYAEHYGEYPTNRLGLDSLELPPDATVVDIGCGTGSALRHASDRVSHGILIGVDPVARMLEIARDQTMAHPAAARIAFRQGAAEDLPIETASADFVLAFDSFDHWQDQGRGLQEVHRILKPRGRFVIVKDLSLPYGREAQDALVEALAEARLEVLDTQILEENDVKCKRWICSIKPT